MDRWAGKVAVVTGASSGIGYAIAVELVQQGLRVVGLARRLDRLWALKQELQFAKGEFFPKKCDVSDEKQIVSAFSWVQSNVGTVAILVNNAGIAPPGTIIDGDYQNWKTIYDCNVLAVCACTREAMQQMLKENIAGHIININSSLGHSVPDYLLDFSVYPASKFSITALTEMTRIELLDKNSKIKVTSISPALTESEATTQIEKMSEVRKQSIQVMPMLKAADVADAIVYVLSTPEHVQVHELFLSGL